VKAQFYLAVSSVRSPSAPVEMPTANAYVMSQPLAYMTIHMQSPHVVELFERGWLRAPELHIIGGRLVILTHDRSVSGSGESVTFMFELILLVAHLSKTKNKHSMIFSMELRDQSLNNNNLRMTFRYVDVPIRLIGVLSDGIKASALFPRRRRVQVYGRHHAVHIAQPRSSGCV